MPSCSLHPKPYFSPEEQVSCRRHWNKGVFTDKAILAMLNTVPAGCDQDQPGIVLALCRSLSSLEETVIADIEIMRHVFRPKRLLVSPRMSQISISGIQTPDLAPRFQPNRLWWEVLYFGNSKMSPSEVDPAIAAGPQVLSAAYNNPDIVTGQTGGKKHHFWDVPGLQVKVDGAAPPFTPYLFGGGDYDVHLDTSSSKLRRLRYDEPTIVSC